LNNVTQKKAEEDFFQAFYQIRNNKKRIIFQILDNSINVGYLYLDILENQTIELSYAISKKYAGNGLATSAVYSAILYVENNYINYTIKAFVAQSNLASRKVMIKNNFTKTSKGYSQILRKKDEEVFMEEYVYNYKRVFIIAEAGVNHNGEIGLAKKLIDAAVIAGADAVKFQTWKTELLVTKDAKQAQYQTENTKIEESQFDMLKKLELSYNDFIELKNYCDSKNIMFLSTPDEIPSANFLVDLQDIFKIGSGELTNLPYLRHIGGLKKQIIISSGMCTLNEIKDALNVIIKAGTKKGDITVLHANTQYPTPMQDVNLNAMLTIKDELGVKVGYSDHTLGIEVDIAAVAMGASCIEKHFTLDKSMEGPDHKASLEPDELIAMVKSIRNIELALGSKIKKPTQSETPNIEIVRKSIVASSSIKKGDILNEENLGVKRPAKGISPMRWDEIIGSIATRDYEEDELI